MLSNWKYRLLNGWSFMRFLRLAMAVFILVEAWKTSDLLVGVLGGVVALQALFSAGCCGVGGCDVNHPGERIKSSEGGEEIVNFKEIK